MTDLDLQKMRQIAENLHVVHASRSFGPEGVTAIQGLMDAITRIYRIVEPSSRKYPLTVLMRVSGQSDLNLGHPDYELPSSSSINHELDEACLVEVVGNGYLRVFSKHNFDLVDLSTRSIVYTYDNRTELFLIGGTHYAIVNPSAAHASIFSRPTYSSLDAAIENYRIRVVRETSCFILENAWADKKRLFWRNKPESTMRRSLHQYLRDVFPGAEVRPEQIVDETHPVDIKVTWYESNKRAIIEIKWLGDSRDEEGNITLKYRDARAREGAKQLSDYLDSDRKAGPGLKTRGYLVVIDGRRRALSPAAVTVAEADGLHYRDLDVSYDPDYHLVRDDFAAPVRMFAEPVIN